MTAPGASRPQPCAESEGTRPPSAREGRRARARGASSWHFLHCCSLKFRSAKSSSPLINWKVQLKRCALYLTIGWMPPGQPVMKHAATNSWLGSGSWCYRDIFAELRHATVEGMHLSSQSGRETTFAQRHLCVCELQAGIYRIIFQLFQEQPAIGGLDSESLRAAQIFRGLDGSFAAVGHCQTPPHSHNMQDLCTGHAGWRAAIFRFLPSRALGSPKYGRASDSTPHLALLKWDDHSEESRFLQILADRMDPANSQLEAPSGEIQGENVTHSSGRQPVHGSAQLGGSLSVYLGV